MSSPTEKIAEFVAGLKYEDLSPQLITKIKRHILDTLGCGLYGARSAEGIIAARVAGELSGKPEATVWGQGVKVDCANAALVNGTMVESFTLDDLHNGSILHPGAVTVPVVSGLAERRGYVSGKEFITAMVAGYEAGIRVGLSIAPMVRDRGYHAVGISGPFAAAAAAAKLLNFNQDQTLHTIGIAGSQGAGLMSAQYNSMVQRLHAGKAAHSGVLSALLASYGFKGITNILEAGYGGFCSTFVNNPNIAKITAGIGEVFELDNTSIRLYACAGAVCTSVEAIKLLKEEEGFETEEVCQVEIQCNEGLFLHSGWEYQPRSVITAQMNIAYGVAVTLLEGNAFVEQYTPEKIINPDILNLTHKVKVKHDPKLDGLGPDSAYLVRVYITLKDGRVFQKEVKYYKGMSKNPVTDEEVINKFFHLAVPTITMQQARNIVDIVGRLEEIKDVSILFKYLNPQGEDSV